jgi:hypothetical protein
LRVSRNHETEKGQQGTPPLARENSLHLASPIRILESQVASGQEGERITLPPRRLLLKLTRKGVESSNFSMSGDPILQNSIS